MSILITACSLGVILVLCSRICGIKVITNYIITLLFVVVQSLSRVWRFVIWWTPGSPVLYCLPKFTQTHVHWIGDASNHLILCRPLLLPSIFPSIRVFSNESALHIRWPEYWHFSFSTGPSSGYSRLFSFRIDWFNILAAQGTLKSLPQPQSSKASITVQLLY